MIHPAKITVHAFCVIGKPGLCEKGSDTVARLWAEANAHFAEAAPFAKKNAAGQPVGFWGAMSRADMSFLPWEDDFSRGLYMAGVEAEEDAIAPVGWKKWIVPGFEALKVRAETPDTFRETLAWMAENQYELVAAVQEFTDPATGESYMLFPIAWNDSKKDLIRRVKARTDPVAYCGFHCDHCFLSEWCGNCRSGCNMCSYATLSDDNRCENEKCAVAKGFDGCYDCPSLTDCQKGFFGTPSGAQPKANSLFIRKYGKAAYSRVMEKAPASGEGKSAEEILSILEEAYKS